MPEIFFIGDTHFGHANILKFEPKLRPFSSIKEHDEALVERWNSVVRDGDSVWHLGDFAFKTQESYIATICNRLKGNKKLILGNHDNFEKLDYRKWFTVYGSYYMRGNFILTHIPVYLGQIERFAANIHGHTHSKNLPNPFYWNVSCEQINCTPISYDDLRKKYAA